MPPPEAAPPPSTSSSTAPLVTSPRTWTDPWKSCSGGVFLAGKEPSPEAPTQAHDPESITEQGRRPKAAAAAVPQPLVRRQPGAQAHQGTPGMQDHANPLGTNDWRRAARLGPRRPQQRLNTRNAGTLLSMNNRTHRPSPKSSTKPPGPVPSPTSRPMTWRPPKNSASTRSTPSSWPLRLPATGGSRRTRGRG